ncbi:PTS ascorbate transporter subunit IIC [Priestia megaterium]|jgi:ascorbate PTS system EIIC component|uniref:Ascorbate-specific PTS system EIIC component n=1 Tax=Priestia megaterium (strain ATCC 14581 / DSM 32 / CCUG 1817 / JCM 2506 / NBRC 15308 / NCIMB 9376 / NCTC 10342 / NRRL B-14308 / VKM B-512 / Ford 19) TaxID=1348623 RepID=A0A0B6ADA7_PRIM2|nr:MULTISPECIES: PTS ascorbate transporter subunit IIC [Priestia]AJI22895.1 PTS system sugar-specific permease component family protein [Priestia megaterium NBRC 15308 = ATCC 14581]KFM97058.1 PTS system sugar-specific permease component family protein [Priestia megaterium]KGJ76068.1 PTS beta-glucoside transporter subunit IIBC [Priestia megaterium NBRC 15308 = ATCC 14581]MCU7710861.1 PTS ascorbate transporter subunit IIC [Priestia megaterium]MCW1044412.1 PTS ascorbate transporter subunit IIC [P
MFDLIMKDILGTPAILVGLFALIGLLLQKKKSADIVSGTLKTIMGFLILGAGANILIASLEAFGKMFNKAFSVEGIIPNNEAIVAVAQQTFGTETAMIMLLGMIVNIIIARITKFKYIFLTGHHTMFMACLIAAILSTGGLTGAPLVLIGALLLGILMVLFPALLQPYVREITGSNDIAVGHFGSLGYLVAGFIGKRVGNREKTTEEIKVPQSLGFLRDTSVSVSLTMTVLFIIVALFAGPAFIETKLSGGQNFIVYSLIQAITFAAGVYVVLAGVRMLLAEIVPAFKGIADKAVPNAIPALDCPTVFPFAPNAVVIGFFSSFIAGLISMFFLPLFGLSIIVPGLVPHFFTGAAAGVFGNATGGRRGAVVGSFANGILISFLPAILLPVLASLGFKGTTFGDSDFSAVGILLSMLIKLFT